MAEAYVSLRSRRRLAATPSAIASRGFWRMNSTKGLASRAGYQGFQSRAEQLKDDFLGFLIEAKRGGKRVGAYGAAAKGNTLLNFAGVRKDFIPYVVDRSPAKQGKYLPGSRIPIVHEARLLSDRPDYVVILPWNLKHEVMEQLRSSGLSDARFVTAIPTLDIV